MEITEEALMAELGERAAGRARQIVAVAAPPGAGKSTLAKRLVRAVNGGDTGPAVLVPMDGFHLDNAVLDARGLRTRKGAPETFDARGFVATVARIRADDGEVAIPRFDPRRDFSLAGAAIVTPDHRLVVVEGNYLLLRAAPWDRLAGLWDLTVWIEVPDAVLEARLIERWLGHGMPPEDARARAIGNDMRNVATIRSGSAPADRVIRQG